MIRGVIFDMDGLMFDTERLWDTLWAPVCAQMGLPAPEGAFFANVRGLAGEALYRHIAAYYPGADATALTEGVKQLAERTFARGVPCKPGLKELLEWLHGQGIPCAVASSSPQAMVQRNLDTTGTAPYFAAVVGGEAVHRSKPDPEIFLLAARQLGVDIRDCLVLEDSHNGVRAGHAAGATTVMVPDLMPVTPEMERLYTRCCHDLAEVRDLLASGAL